jgi:hypothetical protein
VLVTVDSEEPYPEMLERLGTPGILPLAIQCEGQGIFIVHLFV